MKNYAKKIENNVGVDPKNQNAITLVALVITIIVLLILAGIALSLVLGENGITNRAVKAGKTQNISGAKEKLELDVANYGAEFYQAKYVNGYLENNEDTIQGYIMSKYGPVGTKDEHYADGSYTLEKIANDKLKLTENFDQTTSATATINGDGKVLWDAIDYGDGSTSGGNGGSGGTGGGETPVANNATVTVPSNPQVGAYIPYDITYTDVYTNYGFTASDGWRLLSIEDETGKTTKTIKLISTGIPAKLYYKYDSTSNNGWWGTTGNTNVKAAYGLENNFESISFAAGNTAAENSGCFTNINGTTTGNLTGAAFKIEGDNVSVHNLTLGELNAARNSAASSTTSTATTDGATGLFYLRNLATNYNYTTSTNCYYWLASPYASSTSALYSVYNAGRFDRSGGSTYGVRPVVSISGVTLSE